MLVHKALGIGIAAFALLLTTPATALASSEAPWEPELDEGPYIFEGSIGVPNVIVDVVKVGKSFYPETGGDIWGAGEFTGPQGQFRVDIGTCDRVRGCSAAGGDYQVVFHRIDLNKVPWWAPGTARRASAMKFSVPAMNAGSPSLDPIQVTSSAPPDYQTISGTVTGSTGPLEFAQVQAADLDGNSFWDYQTNGAPQVGYTFSGADGTFTMKVPPGQWQLNVRDCGTVGCGSGPRFPNIWAGCKPTQSLSTIFQGGATDALIKVGAACSSEPVDPTPGPGTDPGPGTEGQAQTAYPIRGVKASKMANGGVKLQWKAPAPGTLRATAKLKKLTVAKSKRKVTKAGKVTLKLRTTKAAQKVLAKKGVLKATTVIRFTPAAGTPTTVKRKLTFK